LNILLKGEGEQNFSERRQKKKKFFQERKKKKKEEKRKKKKIANDHRSPQRSPKMMRVAPLDSSRLGRSIRRKWHHLEESKRVLTANDDV